MTFHIFDPVFNFVKNLSMDEYWSVFYTNFLDLFTGTADILEDKITLANMFGDKYETSALYDK